MKTKGAVSLLYYLSLFTEVLGASWRMYATGLPLQGGGKIAKSKEPTSGLEPLTSSHDECAARHLSGPNGLLAEPRSYPSNASTEATLKGLLVVAPNLRCRKTRMRPHDSLGTYSFQLPNLILDQ
jgi:hypothetical protein